MSADPADRATEAFGVAESRTGCVTDRMLELGHAHGQVTIVTTRAEADALLA